MSQRDQRDKTSHDDRLFELLHELVLLHQSSEISDDDQSRLRELLRTSPEARRLYVEYVYENVGISALLQGSSSPVAVIDEPSESTGESNTTLLANSIDRVRSFFTQPTPLSLSVAGLVICSVIGLMALTAAPFYRAFTQRPSLPIVVEKPEAVAQITDEYRVVWREAEEPAPRSRSLLAGRRLDLESGLLELAFANGATVTLQAPAKCIVESKGEITLVHGKLRANVPEEAVGFTLVTSALHIVDLGTEFGAQIAKDGSGEIHVLSGKVELKEPQELESSGKVLTAGEAWKFSPAGGDGQVARSVRQQFSFAVPKPETVVFQNGKLAPTTGEPYSGADDVMLIEWGPDNNFGARPDFDVGQYEGKRAHSLLRFDLSTLSGKVDRVVSATVVITPNTEVFYYPWNGSGSIDLYRFSDANRDWQEGSQVGSGGPAIRDDGAVSWNRFSRQPRRDWAGSRGAAKAGVDYDDQLLANVWYAARTAGPLRFRIRGDLKFIQDWIDGRVNAGFLLRETTGRPENRINFHSCESKNIAARPQLIIQYRPVEPAVSESQEKPDEGTTKDPEQEQL